MLLATVHARANIWYIQTEHEYVGGLVCRQSVIPSRVSIRNCNLVLFLQIVKDHVVQMHSAAAKQRGLLAIPKQDMKILL